VTAEKSTPVNKPVGFLKKQFKHPDTDAQKTFDIVFGILVPILCIASDLFYGLGLFRPGGFLNGALWELSIYCYSEFIIGLSAMGYYLMFRQASAILAGILLGGGIFSLLLGILLLPLSVFGLVIVIGILGLTSFVSSFVFFRNARRCWTQSREHPSRKYFAAMMVLTAVVVVVVPAIPEVYADRIIDARVVNE